MCPDRHAVLSHIVYRKLVARGVEHDKAVAIARKVRLASQLKTAAARDSREAVLEQKLRP